MMPIFTAASTTLLFSRRYSWNAASKCGLFLPVATPAAISRLVKRFSRPCAMSSEAERAAIVPLPLAALANRHHVEHLAEALARVPEALEVALLVRE